MDNDLRVITFNLLFHYYLNEARVFYCQDGIRALCKKLEGNNKHPTKEGNDGTI
jgi:hypothetical protein